MGEGYRNGWIDPELHEEFPELRLVYLTLAGGKARTPPELKARLADLSNGFGGPQAVALRQQPIPWAYRVFFRHIGLDPDRDRTPIEAAAVERIRAGRFPSRGLVGDALCASLVETGVPLWAVDADTIAGADGALGLRPAEEGERLRGEQGLPLPPGRLAVVDERGPIAALFGEPAEPHAITKSTRRITLFTVQVKGVPTMHVEEALEQCCEWLGGGGSARDRWYDRLWSLRKGS